MTEKTVTVECVNPSNGEVAEFRFSVEPRIVYSRGEWLPGVVRHDERFMAEVIAFAINEGGCESDTHYDDDQDVTYTWRVTEGREHIEHLIR